MVVLQPILPIMNAYPGDSSLHFIPHYTNELQHDPDQRLTLAFFMVRIGQIAVPSLPT